MRWKTVLYASCLLFNQEDATPFLTRIIFRALQPAYLYFDINCS